MKRQKSIYLSVLVAGLIAVCSYLIFKRFYLQYNQVAENKLNDLRPKLQLATLNFREIESQLIHVAYEYSFTCAGIEASFILVELYFKNQKQCNSMNKWLRHGSFHLYYCPKEDWPIHIERLDALLNQCHLMTSAPPKS
jgi:hypothetical protein